MRCEFCQVLAVVSRLNRHDLFTPSEYCICTHLLTHSEYCICTHLSTHSEYCICTHLFTPLRVLHLYSPVYPLRVLHLYSPVYPPQSTAPWGTVAQCVALLPHSKKVVGSSPASCNMLGLVPGPFCVEFACSPRVTRVPPRRTPTIKTCKKSRCSSVLTLTKSGPSTWTWSPGRRIAGCPLLLDVPGGGFQDGKKAENTFHHPACACVCVCRVVWQ